MANSNNVISIYNKIARDYADTSPEISEYLDDFLDILPKNGKVLDVGCGVGTDSVYANKKGFEVVGIDASEKMLEIAKNMDSEVDFRLDDMRSAKFEKNEFDGIIASYSFVHIPKKDVSKTLKHLSMFLKPGGAIYVGLQSGKSKEVFIDEPLKPDEKLFLNVYSFDEIRKLLSDEGFEIKYNHERMAEKDELDFSQLCIIAVKK